MPRKILELPRLPALPTKFPLEDEFTGMVEKVISLAEKDPILGALNRVIESIPIIPEKEFQIPWGTYKTPEFYIPKVKPIQMDARQKEAFKAAVMTDLASLVKAIPGLGAVGEPIIDSISDTAYAKIQDTLTPEENKQFKSFDKVDPLSTVAMIRTWIRTQKER